jgi:GNAT superfamily N-acetyltransferase
MKLAHESYTNIKDEIRPLTEQHYDEIALDQDVIKLNPDWDAYARYDSMHALRVYTARDDDGALIGYFVVLVSTSLHYKDHVFANNDIIFLRKDARKGMAGIKLIKYAVECLRCEGVTRININTKTHQPFDAVLERLGFDFIERVYSIVLR